MKREPIGLQLYSVRDEAMADLPSALREVARMGYEGVEFFGRFPWSARDLRAMLDDVGLKGIGYHVTLDWLKGGALSETADFLNLLECDCAVLAVLPDAWRGTEADWRRAAAFINEVSDALARRGIRFGYHNHDMEFYPVEGAVPFELLFRDLAQNVFMELDVGHALRGGADPCALMRKWRGRQKMVHIRDYAPDDTDALVGEGRVNWPEVISLCRACGATKWFIIEQEPSSTPPLVAAERGLRNFEGILADLPV